MKHNNGGFAGISLVAILVVIFAASGIYYTQHIKETSEILVPENSTEDDAVQKSENTDTAIVEADLEIEGDTFFSAYIKKIYTVDDKTFLDADYFQTLRDKDAARRAISEGHCTLNNITDIKEALATVNSLSDNPREFEDAFYKLSSEDSCFSNGIWMDVNDNPKIRTLEIDLQQDIILTHFPGEEYGPRGGTGSAWTISLEALQKMVPNYSRFPTSFELTVSGGKVVKIQEMYRP